MLPTEPAPDSRRRTRRAWPIGLLGVVTAMVVGLGVLIAAQADDEPDPDPTSITVAQLPGLDAVPASPVDAPAPDFTVELFDGSLFTLSDHLAGDGRPVFLNLWASWCVPCRNEMPAIQAASERHQGVLFLGIAVEDDPAAAEAFAAEVAVTYPLGIDESGRISASYEHLGLPATFLITSDGRIASRAFGELSESQIDSLVAGVVG